MNDRPSGEDSRRVLITGGAGFLGINLCRYLLSRGARVAVLDRVGFEYPERDQVEFFDGDVRSVGDVTRAMRGASAVVHAAAALPRETDGAVWSTTVDGTKNVLTCARSLGVSRVVFISSTAVYSLDERVPHTEGDRVEGVGVYGRAKVAAEGSCLAAREGGLCVPILRPKSFIGPERLGVFSLLYDWAYTGHDFPLPGGGHNRFQLLDVEDLCRLIGQCLDADHVVANETFNVGAKVFSTLGEACQVVLDEAGHGGRVRSVPSVLAIAALRGLDRAGLSPVYPWVYETVTRASFVSVSRAERVLEFSPRYSNRDALLRNYRWYVSNRDGVKLTGKGTSHRVPWEDGALGFFKRFYKLS